MRCSLQYHPNTLPTLLQKYIGYFQSKEIGIINASPTAMGLLTNAGPPEWHPASQEVKTLCSQAGAHCSRQGVELGKLSVYHSITALADSVATTLLGVGKMEILKLNLDIVQEGLSNKEMELLEEIKKKYFSDLKDAAWENTEIEKYNNAMNS